MISILAICSVGRREEHREGEKRVRMGWGVGGWRTHLLHLVTEQWLQTVCRGTTGRFAHPCTES